MKFMQCCFILFLNIIVKCSETTVYKKCDYGFNGENCDGTLSLEKISYFCIIVII